ncbi:MFS transporter [Gammaproteobacteria bacterium]|nr:MFS transporter [Gammaproteobacteria bacterium]
MQIPVRFRVIFMSFLAVFICYIDRVNISVAIIPMQEQFGWSESQVGIIFSSFYLGYIFTMTIGGFLADRYGGKLVLGYGLLLWSLFTVLTPAFAYNGFFAILTIRVLMGLGEGITFPSWHALYARWIPFEERTRSIAITNSGISVGTVFGYLVTSLIIASYSWEWVFYSFGMLGVIWFFFWQQNVTSYPSDHKDISSKELDFIIRKAPANSSAPKISILKVITNLPFLAITVATFCHNWALFIFLSYLPKFINSPESLGGLGIALDSSVFIFLILIPSFFSVVSLIAGGFLADSLIKKKYQVIKVRKVLNSIGFFGSACCLFLIPFQDSHFFIISLLCATNICTGIAAGGFGVNHADLGPRYTGTLVGISGSLGMIAAVIGPLAAGFILDITNSWELIFHICSYMLLFGGIFYLIFASTDKQFE